MTFDAVAAAIRSRQYANVNELADVLATALAGNTRQQSNRRGLYDATIVNVTGGTKLSVEDQSASRKSISMQPPQRMLPMKNYGAVTARHQVRSDIKTRTVPDIVQQSLDGGATLRVTPIDDIPRLSIDPVTRENIVSNPVADLSRSTAYNLQQNGYIDIDATNITTLPDPGDVVMISVYDQPEQRTVWTDVAGRKTPRVFTINHDPQGYLIGGPVPDDDQDIYGLIDSQEFTYEGGLVSPNSWPVNFTDVNDYLGQPYCVFAIGTDTPSGTVERRTGDPGQLGGPGFPYFTYGVVGEDPITFTVSPFYVLDFELFHEVTPSTGDPLYKFFFMIGTKISGQNVLFGDIHYEASDGTIRDWTITDPNFPVAL